MIVDGGLGGTRWRMEGLNGNGGWGFRQDMMQDGEVKMGHVGKWEVQIEDGGLGYNQVEDEFMDNDILAEDKG